MTDGPLCREHAERRKRAMSSPISLARRRSQLGPLLDAFGRKDAIQAGLTVITRRVNMPE